MSISFFDSLIESTSAIADAVFGKTFEFCYNGQTCQLTATLSAHPIADRRRRRGARGGQHAQPQF